MSGTKIGPVLRGMRACFGDVAHETAIFLVYDRPGRENERPGLRRVAFLERCVTDAQLDTMIRSLREAGCYVELFEGDIPFLNALANSRIQNLDRRVKLVYNGIEGGVAPGAFRPGRTAIVPAVSDTYGISCANSSAYGCAIARNKFHYLTLLRALGVLTPRVWQFGPQGWVSGAPEVGVRVIAKSAYESWSVGIESDSVMTVDADIDEKLRPRVTALGQPLCVQEFISGQEVYVPVFATPDPLAGTAVRAVVTRAPDDADVIITLEDSVERGGLTYTQYVGCDRDALGAIAVDVYKKLELNGIARVDFRIDGNGDAHLFDVASSPGIGTDSALFASVAIDGLTYSEFLQATLASSLLGHGIVSPLDRLRLLPEL